ncbi:hypothetical protein [Colwellia psychrerythraea]|nr:hypothetical protein [Colwellia psychrerythraea]
MAYCLVAQYGTLVPKPLAVQGILVDGERIVISHDDKRTKPQAAQI